MTDRTIVEAVKKEFCEALFAALGRFPEAATPNDRYLALALAVRRQVMRRWVATSETYYKKASRTVCYLSAEFLLGPHLGNNLLNLGLQEEARQAMSELGHDLDAILAQEEEPGLGNGGLGRLAACYMDSLATLEIPALGYGIRYEFGIFDQLIRDGWQVEKTDKWLALGNPWETPRPEIAADVLPRRPHRGLPGRAGPLPRALGARARRARGRLRRARSSATGTAPRTCCACGRRRPPSPSTSRPSTRGTTGGRWTRRWTPRTSPRSSTRTTRW